MGFVTNGSIQIHYDIIGSGKPIVMIHAIHGSLVDWAFYEFTSSLKNFQLILIDLRGHGKSSKPLNSDAYNPRIQASDIKKVLDHLHLTTVMIWGYSYGGRIVYAFAIYYPKMVSKLIVGGMHPYPVKNIYYKIQQRKKWLEQGLYVFLEKMKINFPEPLLSLFLENDKEALVRIDECILQWQGFGADLKRLRERKFPIILYIGSKDYAYRDLVSKFLEEFAPIQFIEIEEYRHFDALTEGKVIVGKIIEYINE